MATERPGVGKLDKAMFGGGPARGEHVEFIKIGRRALLDLLAVWGLRRPSVDCDNPADRL